MKTTTILVIGYTSQEQTALQIEKLQQFGAEVIVIEPHGGSEPGDFGVFAWEGNNVYWHDIDISSKQLSAILMSTRLPETPGKDTFLQAPGQRLLWQDWIQHYTVQRHFTESLHSLLLNYEHAGVPMFNPPGQTMLTQYWPYQLRMLQSSGARVPPTLLSNHPNRVVDFINKHGDCTIKPAASSSPALSANQLLAGGQLQARAFPPAILQQRVRGEDVRAIMVNGRVTASYMIVRPRYGSQAANNGQAQYIEISLPKSVDLQCRRAAALLGLKFNSFDLRKTEDDQYYLLECNPLPNYIEVEKRLHLSITADLCHALLAAD